ncbi:hypothetical protein MRX96_016053 [Rhipicephalus microplus]
MTELRPPKPLQLGDNAVAKVCLTVQLDQRRVLLELFTVKKKQAILGLEASDKLGLVNRVNMVDDSNGYASLIRTRVIHWNWKGAATQRTPVGLVYTHGFRHSETA